jgi:mono/diheme cytochrome c family protein
MALFALAVASASSASAAEPDGPVMFESQVRPILKAHCYGCHGEEPKIKAKLDLRFVRAMLKGGRSGEAIVPGDREGSFLWHRITADEMPPGDAKLSDQEKATIFTWIKQGARTLRPEPETIPPPGPVFGEEERAFWSFQPIQRPEVPRVKEPGRVRNPIDAFLLAKLESSGLSFSPEADRPTLIRRASFDLRGLPPTPEEVKAFVQDENPDAYERLIDRLLASPEYGERWARHWMDTAGYADSDGDMPKDAVRPYAYKYRDYLIRSLDADRSWDELIREQLAGDEMLKPPYQDLSPEDQDKLIATGFLRMATDGSASSGAEAIQVRNDVLAETVKVVSSSFLGLTVGCAQCHTHRYDPISHEDYHRLRALFEPAYNPAKWRTPTQRLISLWTKADRDRAAEVDAELREVVRERKERMDELVSQVLEKELAAAPEELRTPLREAREVPPAKRSEEQKALLKTYPRVLVTAGNVRLYDGKAAAAITKEFDEKTDAVKAKRPEDNFVQALTEVPGQAPVTRLFSRGDPNSPMQEVAPGELSLLASLMNSPEIPADDPALPTTGRRLAYAKHLTSGNHPLVPRVLVNRVWMHHVGRGIVATPADFGVLGDRPTHPELLDWLASEFVQDGWRLKPLHRLIMTSTAYRQTTFRDPKLDAIDPDNNLLGRMSVRRLEAEVIRDAILAASGRLDRARFGPPLPVALDESGQVLIGLDTRDDAGRQRGKPGSLGNAEFRRSLYVQVRRSLPLSFTETFDTPTLTPNCERRTSSTGAPQSLTLMNNDFVVEQSLAFADRVIKASGPEPEARARLAWQIALGTDPSAEQTASAVRFLTEQTDDFASAEKPGKPKPGAKGPTPPDPSADPDRWALATFCQALFGSNNFLYVD